VTSDLTLFVAESAEQLDDVVEILYANELELVAVAIYAAPIGHAADSPARSRSTRPLGGQSNGRSRAGLNGHQGRHGAMPGCPEGTRRSRGGPGGTGDGA